MDYQQAMDYLHKLARFGSKPGLQRMDYLLAALGNPERSLRAIHVGGTNGKGSTCAMTTTILRQAGYRVAAFTKPHLQSFTERTMIDGQPIPEGKVAELVSRLAKIADGMEAHGVDHATEFEMSTALMFKHFADERVDFAVIEVGLGGLLDSTNVLPSPLVSVITNIDYDHTEILGSTLTEIADQKAGIIKPGGFVVTAAQAPEALAVIEGRARAKAARLWRVVPEESAAETGAGPRGGAAGAEAGSRDAHSPDLITYRALAVDQDGSALNVTTPRETYRDLQVPLLGAHQVINAATAVGVIAALRERGVAVEADAVRRGLEKARWPGRIEVMQRDPLVIIDGAHNHDGARVLRDAIGTIFPKHRVSLVVGILADKEIPAVLGELVPLAERVIVTRPESSRAADPRAVAEAVRGVASAAQLAYHGGGADPLRPPFVRVIETPAEAVRTAVDEAARGGRVGVVARVKPSAAVGAAAGWEDPAGDRPPLVLVTGSLYLIGKIRSMWFDKVEW
ncbi:MAG: bifunctional folylpolyglutamate synthase/dihydrofolate synthase [Bacillota bacterium]